jgi:hypothetical protein
MAHVSRHPSFGSDATHALVNSYRGMPITVTGQRTRRKVSGTTKAAVVDKLRDLRTQLDTGITPKAGYAHYTLRQAAGDWWASPHNVDTSP